MLSVSGEVVSGKGLVGEHQNSEQIMVFKISFPLCVRETKKSFSNFSALHPTVEHLARAELCNMPDKYLPLISLNAILSADMPISVNMPVLATTNIWLHH